MNSQKLELIEKNQKLISFTATNKALVETLEEVKSIKSI
jgi:hypothetical protein